MYKMRPVSVTMATDRSLLGLTGSTCIVQQLYLIQINIHFVTFPSWRKNCNFQLEKKMSKKC